jgi:hypothetical protein
MSIIDSTIELGEAVRFALTRKADPAVLKHIEEESARIREELRKRHGLTNVAAELIREVREE